MRLWAVRFLRGLGGYGCVSAWLPLDGGLLLSALSAFFFSSHCCLVLALAMWTQGPGSRLATLAACILVVPMLALIGATLGAVILVDVVLAEGRGVARIFAFLACVAVAIMLAYP